MVATLRLTYELGKYHSNKLATHYHDQFQALLSKKHKSTFEIFFKQTWHLYKETNFAFWSIFFSTCSVAYLKIRSKSMWVWVKYSEFETCFDREFTSSSTQLYFCFPSDTNKSFISNPPFVNPIFWTPVFSSSKSFIPKNMIKF